MDLSPHPASPLCAGIRDLSQHPASPPLSVCLGLRDSTYKIHSSSINLFFFSNAFAHFGWPTTAPPLPSMPRRPYCTG